MPMLGDILAAARDSSSNFQAWLERSNPELGEEVQLAAKAHGLTVTGYVRGAIADFNRFAPEEDWASLTSGLRNTEDPGTTCLLAMVHWRLNAKGCALHSQHPERHGNAEGAQ